MIRISPRGFDADVADEAALQHMATVARSAGISATLVELLDSPAEPTVARVRAYSIVGRKLTFTA
jgi:hypothetical protein